jgi:hypothetical protein
MAWSHLLRQPLEPNLMAAAIETRQASSYLETAGGGEVRL